MKVQATNEQSYGFEIKCSFLEMRLIIGALPELSKGITNDYSMGKVKGMEKCLTTVYEKESGEGIWFEA